MEEIEEVPEWHKEFLDRYAAYQDLWRAHWCLRKANVLARRRRLHDAFRWLAEARNFLDAAGERNLRLRDDLNVVFEALAGAAGWCKAVFEGERTPLPERRIRDLENRAIRWVRHCSSGLDLVVSTTAWGFDPRK